MAGTTGIGSANVAGLIGFIQSGKLKALVLTGKKRWPDLPDVRERMLKTSFAAQYEGPDQLRARIAREVPMWKDLVVRAGSKIN